MYKKMLYIISGWPSALLTRYNLVQTTEDSRKGGMTSKATDHTQTQKETSIAYRKYKNLKTRYVTQICTSKIAKANEIIAVGESRADEAKCRKGVVLSRWHDPLNWVLDESPSATDPLLH